MERLNVVQERLFYFLNTIRGSTVLRHRWDGVNLGNSCFLDKSTCTEMQKEKLEEDADTDKVILPFSASFILAKTGLSLFIERIYP